MNKQQRNSKPHNTGFRRNYFENGRYAGEVNRYGVFDMKQQCNSSQQRFRNGAERHANRFATSASRSNYRYSLSETHATPDGHAVKQIGEHTWLIEKAGIVVHRCPPQPIYRKPHFCIELRRQSVRAGFHIIRSTSHG